MATSTQHQSSETLPSVISDQWPDSWIASLVDSRASPIAVLTTANRREPLTPGTSGLKPLDAFAKWSPDGYCWRTFQVSLLTGMAKPLSASLPKSGMTVSGTAYRLLPLVHHTSAGGGGASQWNTPNTMDGLKAKSQKALDHEYSTARPGRTNPNNLRDQVAVTEGLTMWPTPTGTPYGTGNNYKVNEGQPAAHRPSLATMAKTGMWPTQAGGQLNPMWVEWLMGFPVGWTDLNPLAMELYQQWSHGFARS